jgi:hypothetical protein
VATVADVEPGVYPLTFLSGFVQDRSTARVIAQLDNLNEQGVAFSWLMKWTRADGKWGRFDLHWNATRMWVLSEPQLQVFSTGPGGIVSILVVGGSSEETIDNTAEGPGSHGPIRDLRGISGRLYVCGMSRQVYRREGPNRWVRRDAGVLLLPGQTQLAGFNSIDGLAEDDIYAVGFVGEIWRQVQGIWHAIDSPTNVILNRVRVVAPDRAYAAGQKGVLLRGNGDVWTEIKHGATTDDFWGMEYFREKLYVSTDNAIYRLTADDNLEKLTLKDLPTCGHLHANDGVMWSFGTKHLAYTEDAVTWFGTRP